MNISHIKCSEMASFVFKISISIIGLINPLQEKPWNILMSSYFVDFSLTRISTTLKRLWLAKTYNIRHSLIVIRIETSNTRPASPKKFLSNLPTIWFTTLRKAQNHGILTL